MNLDKGTPVLAVEKRAQRLNLWAVPAILIGAIVVVGVFFWWPKYQEKPWRIESVTDPIPTWSRSKQRLAAITTARKA